MVSWEMLWSGLVFGGDDVVGVEVEEAEDVLKAEACVTTRSRVSGGR